ncbi:hypothetical protein [Mycobacteroides chelonae]|uniref:hypothetical protein n=1 Tax=Mycobacteroides chelonae TaxID=1774 RepID=UPI0035638280
MEFLEKVVVPLVGIIIGWLLATWAGARHRGWGSLGTDLDLAEKFAKADLPAQALILRQYAAVRVKGRIMADTRKRRELSTAAPFLLMAPASVLYLGFAAYQWAQKADMFNTISATFLGVLLVAGAVSGVRQARKRYFRVPGVSMLALEGTGDAIARLSAEIEHLNKAAGDLPDVLTPPTADEPRGSGGRAVQ